MGRRLWLLALVGSLVFVGGARAATSTLDENGTVILDGAKVFPIVLAKGPELDVTTPSGASAVDEVIGAGVNFFKVGPATTPWTTADIADAKAWDEALAGRHAYTWINLATVATATPGSASDSLLQQVVTTLTGDAAGQAGIGLWRGADEPLWSGISPSALQFAYCRSTGRGDPSWCGGEPVLDRSHLWVTVQAPRGTAAGLSPYSAVTDVHGVDEYPIGINVSAPDLHQVGVWTSTIASVTPDHAVWSRCRSARAEATTAAATTSCRHCRRSGTCSTTRSSTAPGTSRSTAATTRTAGRRATARTAGTGPSGRTS